METIFVFNRFLSAQICAQRLAEFFVPWCICAPRSSRWLGGGAAGVAATGRRILLQWNPYATKYLYWFGMIKSSRLTHLNVYDTVHLYQILYLLTKKDQ